MASLKSKLPLLALVLVEWRDSTSPPQPWRASLDETEVCTIRTSGFLVRYDEDEVVLVQGLTPSGSFHNSFAIPRGCVDSVRVIKEGLVPGVQVSEIDPWKPARAAARKVRRVSAKSV
jgi:hypothetical protein